MPTTETHKVDDGCAGPGHPPSSRQCLLRASAASVFVSQANSPPTDTGGRARALTREPALGSTRTRAGIRACYRSLVEPRQFSDGDRGGDFLGRPKVEWSTMGTGATTGTKLLVARDFSGYTIVDRLGTTAELIPHLFGATNRFPTGQRGYYVYGRTGAAVTMLNAFRYLEVK